MAHGNDPLLIEREMTHGNFETNATIAQNIKACVGHKLYRLTLSQREALDMIATKIGRITSGDPNVVDHWEDIAGYANLVANQLRLQKSLRADTTKVRA